MNMLVLDGNGRAPDPTDRTCRAAETYSPPNGERSNGPDAATIFKPSVTMWLANLGHPHPVTRLRALAGLREELDAMIDATVAEARGMRPKPATWREIGQAAGLTKTAAQAHWGPRRPS